MPRIFITSDTHFGHNKDFIWKVRGFKSIEEHDEEIVKRWNNVVKPDDIVYHLGDVMLGDNKKSREYLKRLNGKIYIAIGNHDTDKRLSIYDFTFNIFDVQMGYRIKHKKKTYILTHYPTIVGNKDDPTPVYNLCGHTHTTNPFEYFDYKIYNVGMDAHNYTPILLDDIVADIHGHCKCNCANCTCKNNS